MKSQMIKQYVRNKKGVPIGVLVAVQSEDKSVVSVGYSLCHKHDHFEKKKGTMIAVNRALSNKIMNVPETLEKSMKKFIKRASNYYYPIDSVEDLR